MAEITVYVDGEDQPRRFRGDPNEVKNILDRKFSQIRNLPNTTVDTESAIDQADRLLTDPENRRVFANLVIGSNPIESVRAKINDFMAHTPFPNPVPEGQNISAGDIARQALSFTPGVGDIQSAAEAVQFAKEDRPYMATLSSLSALPFVPSVAGTLGKRVADLPMDEASRMARAREMGFYEGMPLYHGTGREFKEFKLPEKSSESVSRSPVGTLGVSLATDPRLANEFASRAGGEGANVIPALHRAKNPVSIDLDGTETNEEIFATVSDAWEKGFDSIKFNNYTTKEGGSGQSFILVKDPSQVRSRFAKFDPKKKLSPNLLAGAAGATLVTNAMLQNEEN